METSQCKESPSVRASISKSLSPLLILSSFALANQPPLCESYTPGERCLSCDYGLTVRAEGLYWTSRENHLILGITLAGLQPTDQIPPALDRWDFQGDVIRIDPDWDFGYRVGIGYTSPCDYWELSADFTSFHTDKSEHLDLLQLPAWNPWGHPDTEEGVRLFDLKGSWNLKYDRLNFELGRAFWIGRCITLRPHFGITCGWIDQDFCLVFDYQPQNFVPFGSTFDLGCDFSGAGLSSGLVIHLTNGTGFGVYGKFALSLLYGTFDSSLSQVEFFANAPGADPNERLLIADTTDKHHMGITTFQGMLGVNWNRSFCCERYRFGLTAAWEFNQLNDINEFHQFSHFLQSGIYRMQHTSLVLMGLTFGGSFDF